MLTSDELGLFIYLSETENKKEIIVEDLLNYSNNEDLEEIIVEEILDE